MPELESLVAATNNPHKLRELRRLFPGYRVSSPVEEGIDFSYREEGGSYLENAYGKALALYRAVGKPVLADDSGLEVAALGGEPGLYSSRYGAEPADRKLSDPDRNALLLRHAEHLEDRRCAFVCCLVLVLEQRRLLAAQETLPGVLARKPSGSGGFGYDPIVFIPEKGKTVAELSDREKDEISHRGQAARRILWMLRASSGPSSGA